MSNLDDILQKLARRSASAVSDMDVWFTGSELSPSKRALKNLFLELIDVPPCEENCTDVRHAYHQGQWDLAQQITKKVEEL